MQFLTEWISNIILLILLATILELLLPNSSLQRYVKMVVGLLLIVIILNPIFSILSRDSESWINSLSLHSHWEEKNIEISIENKKKDIQGAQLAYISEQVAVQLRRQVEEELIAKFEKEIKTVNVTLEDFFEEEDFVTSIAHVSVELMALHQKSQKTDLNSVEVVSLVTIDTNKRVESFKKEVSSNEDIVQYLASQWPIPIEKIDVIVEGGS